MRLQLERALAVCLLAGAIAAPAVATPVTFHFVSGTATLDIDVSGNLIHSASAPLTGTFTTFDAMTPAVTDLQWVIQDSVDLGTLLGTLAISVVVTDGTGFSGPAMATGGGSFDWSGGPFDVLANISLTGGLAGDFTPAPINASVSSDTGTVTISGNTATVTAAKQTMFSFNHSGKTVTVSASISFVGVPEPSALALLGVACAGLAAARRRHAV